MTTAPPPLTVRLVPIKTSSIVEPGSDKYSHMLYRPHDSDLTFYLQVYRDAREARWCLRNLRQHYPTANILIVSDGDNDPVWPRIARRFGARYVAGQRLYDTEFGGRLVQRMLDLFAENPTPYLIKIDTDTWAHRRLRHLPTGCRVFGTLEWITWADREPLGYPNVQGGFVGYTREAVSLIRSSKVLLSTRLQDYASTYADVEDIHRRAVQGMVSFDFLTRYACRSLGITCEEFDEVKSQYRGWVRETQGQFAFTHPHKEVAQRGPLMAALREYTPAPVKEQVLGAAAWAKALVATATVDHPHTAGRADHARPRLHTRVSPPAKSDAA